MGGGLVKPTQCKHIIRPFHGPMAQIKIQLMPLVYIIF